MPPSIPQLVWLTTRTWPRQTGLGRNRGGFSGGLSKVAGGSILAISIAALRKLCDQRAGEIRSDRRCFLQLLSWFSDKGSEVPQTSRGIVHVDRPAAVADESNHVVSLTLNLTMGYVAARSLSAARNRRLRIAQRGRAAPFDLVNLRRIVAGSIHAGDDERGPGLVMARAFGGLPLAEERFNLNDRLCAGLPR